MVKREDWHRNQAGSCPRRRWYAHIAFLTEALEGGAFYAVPRALLYRYFKRITANLSGVVSAVVSPVDQIDYYADVDYDD